MALTSFQILHSEAYNTLLARQDFSQILEIIRERKFSRKDVLVTPRELNHWKSKKLLYEDYEDSKWKKFSIVDIIWIQIINELRKYELPLATLYKIKQNLKSDFDVSSLLDTSSNEILEVVKMSVSEELRDKITIEVLGSIASEITNQFKPKDFFELIVIESYLLKYQNRLVANFDGVCLFYTELYHDEYLASEEYKLHFEQSHISLSVNALVSSVFKDYSVNELALDWKLISPKEQNILQEIKSQENIKSLKIRFNENSEIDLLEIVDEIKMTPQDYLKKVIVEGSYLDIRIVTQNGDIVFCERTTKKKI